MGSFGHEPVHVDPPEAAHIAARNARYGLILFVIYCLIYGGFVGVSAFAPELLEINLGGINLAIWYGLLLIVAAMVMAIIYTFLCRERPQKTHPPLT